MIKRAVYIYSSHPIYMANLQIPIYKSVYRIKGLIGIYDYRAVGSLISAAVNLGVNEVEARSGISVLTYNLMGEKWIPINHIIAITYEPN